MSEETGSHVLGILEDVELPIEVRLGTAELTLEEVLRLGPGGVVSLGPVPDQPVELAVSGVRFATGELVIVDGSFAFRVGRVVGGEGILPETPPGSTSGTAPAPGERDAPEDAAPASVAGSAPEEEDASAAPAGSEADGGPPPTSSTES